MTRPVTSVACGGEALLGYRPRHRRRILCAFPEYSKSFGTFDHAFPLMGPVRAFMPPQGILQVAALLPAAWETRFVDENVRRIREDELAWADAVLISGMHIQRSQIRDLQNRAHRHGTLAVLGGPSASAAPEFYPHVDILHCGEVGDATAQLFAMLDESCQRRSPQVMLRTSERLPLDRLPPPAYHHVDLRRYLLASVSSSSGCPFRCEFCDIPFLYGRRPRRKRPDQVVSELETLARGGTPSIYFVDDNFIADPHAALELLPHVVRWQERWDYRIRLACEASLNIVQHIDLLELMRRAGFTHVFCGIETPEPDALRSLGKTQNLRTPMLEAISTLNRYGLEVAAGMILGFDTDTDQTAGAIIDFVRASQIPIVTINLVHALPHTPLYERLARAGRLNPAPDRESNVEFLRPYDAVIEDWKHIVRTIYDPVFLYQRYSTQAERTYPNRLTPRRPLAQLTFSNLQRAAGILARMVWKIGWGADYRSLFWQMFRSEARRGRIENIFQIAMTAHHLITYGRECVAGATPASHFSSRRVEQAAETTALTSR